MIIDRIENLNKYVQPDDMKKIDSFIDKISPEMEDGYYEIDGKNIYARVMTYSTKMRDDCKIEAHNKYIDIQSTICGCEGIDIYCRKNLKEKTPYQDDKDVCYYNETEKPYITVENIPGIFSFIGPEEAHRPQISTDKQLNMVKKFVIKIRCMEA